ncbi:MAG: FG-GAP repeat domain-containing protein, partial [Limisphaerales bacterium]
MSHVAKSLENLTRITTLFRCAAFLALAALSIWNESAEWQFFPGGRAMALTNIGGSSNGFHLLDPNFTQVIFTNELKETRAATNRTLYNGSGLATGDIDDDGLIDVVFVGLESQIQVFKNLGGWVFSNVTGTSGLRLTNVVCRGVTLADLDGDGALDLLVTANHRGVLSWRNDGQGKFTEITREAGTASSFGSLTVTLADVDGNGSLDLYVANNRSEDIRDQGEVRLSMVGGKRTVPAALRNRLVLFGEQILEYGEPDFLLLNDGSGRFRPASWTADFVNETGKPLPGAPLDWGLSAAFRDLNGDLAPDLYVCNDFWTPDRIWINGGRGKFRAAHPLAFRQTSASSMGVDMADLNFDGSPEIFVLDMLSRSPAWRKRQMEAQRSFMSLPGVFTDRPQSLRNTLFLSRSDGTYAEIANFAGLAAA